MVFADMTHTAQDPGALFGRHAEVRLQFAHVRYLQRQVANRLFYCGSLMRDNIIATNLQRFTSSYDSRRFAACDC